MKSLFLLIALLPSFVFASARFEGFYYLKITNNPHFSEVDFQVTKEGKVRFSKIQDEEHVEYEKNYSFEKLIGDAGDLLKVTISWENDGSTELAQAVIFASNDDAYDPYLVNVMTTSSDGSSFAGLDKKAKLKFSKARLQDGKQCYNKIEKYYLQYNDERNYEHHGVAREHTTLTEYNNNLRLWQNPVETELASGSDLLFFGNSSYWSSWGEDAILVDPKTCQVIEIVNIYSE